MTLEEAIYEKLMDADDILAIAKREVYRGFRSQGQKLPCVTFTRITTSPVNGAAGSSGTEHAIIQIDCWARKFSEARSLADAVKKEFDGWRRTTAPVIGAAICTDEQDIPEPPDEGGQLAEYRVTQTWSIWNSLS